jgi:hypothetical protein
VTTNPGFENEQFELNSADPDIHRLAIQAANKLDELIQRRKTASESARRLADVLKKSFQLQPVSAAADGAVDPGTAAVFSPAVDESASGGDVSTLAHLQTARTAILNKLVPIGYEDETGFHYGVEGRRSAARKSSLVRLGGAMVVMKRSMAGGQSG